MLTLLLTIKIVMQSTSLSENFFKTACYFEASLIAVALVLGMIADINPFADLYFSETAIALGIVGTLPLFLLFLISEHLALESVQAIKKMLLETLCPNLYQHHWADLLILSAIAGIGEEALFRGVLQPWLERSWGMNTGLIASGMLFGLVHAVTPLYAVLATLISIYLGLSLDYGGSRNLFTPIIIHGLYDFLVFLVLMKAYKAQLPQQ
jgi:membrane protease YdiL (CAAX protease family)